MLCSLSLQNAALGLVNDITAEVRTRSKEQDVRFPGTNQTSE